GSNEREPLPLRRYASLVFLRRVIRWALTILLLAMLSLTIASEWYELGWRHGRAGGRRGLEDHIWIGTGALRGARHDWGRRPPPPSGFYIERYQPRSFWSGPPTFCWFDASFDGPG